MSSRGLSTAAAAAYVCCCCCSLEQLARSASCTGHMVQPLSQHEHSVSAKEGCLLELLQSPFTLLHCYKTIPKALDRVSKVLQWQLQQKRALFRDRSQLCALVTLGLSQRSCSVRRLLMASSSCLVAMVRLAHISVAAKSTCDTCRIC
jgi:hypothetical protein